MGNKVTKPVAFNITKEVDKKLLKYLQKRNFSGYVKKLIMADMQKKEAVKTKPLRSLNGEIKFELK